MTTDQLLRQIKHKPHLLGHAIGKTLLQPIHSDWIKYIWDSGQPRSLQAHRGSYKTTGIELIGIIRHLLFHPNDRVALVRKSLLSDAIPALDEIRKAFETPEIKSIFKQVHGFYPGFVRKQGTSLTFNFKSSITKEGSIDCYGIDTSVVGKHYDVVLFDDIVNIKDRISRAERERTNRMYEEWTLNIIDPCKPYLLIGTPWHEEDVWSIEKKIVPLKYPIDEVNILSQAEKEDIKAKTKSFAYYSINYLLKHAIDDDAMFPNATFENWKFYLDSIGHIDVKYSGTDTMALTFMSKKEDGRYQGYGKVFTEHIEKEKHVIADLYKKYKCGRMWIETNKDEGYASRSLQQLGIHTEEYREKANKFNKIYNYVSPIWDLIDWDHDTDPEYLKQVTQYKEGMEPDDAPDSLGSLSRQAGFAQPYSDTAYTDRWSKMRG